jgi:hypothetical protein
MIEPPRSSGPSSDKPLPGYTPDLAARRKAIEMAIASETELYRERMAAYQHQLAEIERQSMPSADTSADDEPQSART